jgi:hypothetical protein
MDSSKELEQVLLPKAHGCLVRGHHAMHYMFALCLGILYTYVGRTLMQYTCILNQSNIE